MEHNFYYSTVEDATSATMRIYSDISCFGVDCTLFVSEMEQLANMGITNLSIRINSVGGNVIDGFGIFSAMQTSKMKITTYNDGLAASTAGWIFVGGNEAIMADYSLLMMHNPFSMDSSAKGQEVTDLMKQSIATILSKRSGQTMEAVSTMMNEETWLNADRCIELGFATAKADTEKMVKLDPSMQNVAQMFEVCNSALGIETRDNIAEPTQDSVEKTEQNEANEHVTEEITQESTEDKVKEEKEEDPEMIALKLKNAELEASVESQKQEYEDVSKRLAEMEIVLNSYKQAEIDKQKKEQDDKIESLIDEAIASGKIRNESKSEWTNLANLNFDTVKSTLGGMTSLTFKKAVKVTDSIKATLDSAEVSLRELEKTNPKRVEEIYNTNRALYNDLFYREYGVMP